jgi:hypothetical protein
VKTIELTQGYVALVDDEDYERLSRWRWHANVVRGGRVCALRKKRHRGRMTTIYMHREIVGAKPGQQVDHINGDALDNRRGNLRICTISQNNQNRYANTGASSQYKGVCWDKGADKWRATITAGGRRKYLGTFEDEREAALAYDAAARELFGEFARPNLPMELAA